MSSAILIQVAQQPIDRKMSDALFGVLPEGWAGIRLEARRQVTGPTSESYRIELKSTEGLPGLASVSEELEDAVRQLFMLHRRYATDLSLARYLLEEGPAGWGLVSEFEYGRPVVTLSRQQ